MQERDMKYKEGMLLMASHQNWGLHSTEDWTETQWEVFYDGRVEIFVQHDGWKEYELSLSKEDLTSFQMLLNIDPPQEQVVALDGSAWAMTTFSKDGSVIWNRNLGYIYGLKPYEAIASRLYEFFGRFGVEK